MSEMDLEKLFKLTEVLPKGLRYAMKKIAPSYLKYGMNYGYILSKEEFKEHREDLDEIENYIQERFPMNYNNQYCFNMWPKMLKESLKYVYKDTDVEMLEQHEKEAKLAIINDKKVFTQFIKKSLEMLDVNPIDALSKEDNESDLIDKIELPIALYSLNESNRLQDDGFVYNAYKFNYQTFLNVLEGIDETLLYRCLVRHIDSPDLPSNWLYATTKQVTQFFKPVIRTDTSTNEQYVAGVCFILKIMPYAGKGTND